MHGSIGRLVYIGLLTVMGCLLLVSEYKRRTGASSRYGFPSMARLTEVMLEGYLGLDSDGKIVEVNDSYLAMSGYRRNELVGMHIERLAVSKHEGQLFEQLARVHHQSPASYRGHHRAKDGTLIPIEVSVATFEEGKIAFICLYRDLREQERAEEEVQHTLELLRYVVEHTRSAVAIFDTSMCYLFVSEKYRQEYHIHPETNLIGENHYTVIPDLPERWKDIHTRALRGEVLRGDDDRYERSNGSIEYTRWECRPWYEGDGSIGGMVLYTENITAQKQFEGELMEARDYLSTLITQANAPIVVWDEEFTIVRTNPVFAKLFGKEVGHLVGNPLSVLREYIDESVWDQALLLIRTNERIGGLELCIKQADGSVKTILWTVAVITSKEEGHTQTVIAQGQDISERKEVEEQNREQLTMLRRWYAVMAHREERVLELKGEVNALLREQDKPIRYGSAETRRGM